MSVDESGIVSSSLSHARASNHVGIICATHKMSSPKFDPAKNRGRPAIPAKKGSLGGRIRAARNDLGMSSTELAARVGVNQSNISRIERGEIEPDRTTLVRLAQELRADFGDPSLTSYAATSSRELKIEARVAAGAPIVRLDDESISIGQEFANLKGDICALRVSGDSMTEDHILDGDILICRRTPEPRKDAIVVVDFKGEVGASLKRWRKRGETVILSSDHYSKEAPKYEFPTWRLGKVFEVVGLIRRMK